MVCREGQCAVGCETHVGVFGIEEVGERSCGFETLAAGGGVDRGELQRGGEMRLGRERTEPVVVCDERGEKQGFQ